MRLSLRYVILALFLFFIGDSASLFAVSPGEVLPGTVLDWKGWFTVILFGCAFFALVREFLPPDVIMLVSAGILVIMGIITPTQFLKNFSRDIIFTLAMLFMIAQAMEVSGVLNLISRWILPGEVSRWRQLLTMMCPIGFFSAFLNNTPIVLMVTPIVRRWALERNLKPSLFFIPVSYAAILGGVCTLIGTSCNLVVDGLMRAEDPNVGFSFFEIGWIGVPCALLGFVYMATVGARLLPERPDPAVSLSEETREFTSEFRIQPDSPLASLSVEEASRRFFRGELLIEIERGDVIIDSPALDEILMEKDRLIFAGDIKQIAELHTIEGLQSLADPHFQLDVNSPHFSEVVVSITSSLIGKSLKKIDFRNSYGASVIAIYRQGYRIPGRVGNVVLHAGDTLMLLSKEAWHGGDYHTNDFYYLKHNEEIPLYSPWRVALVSSALTAMIFAVLLGVPIFIASMGVALTCFFSGTLSIREARRSIQWNVLVLIASSFSMGIALHQTGVAGYLAELVLPLIGVNQYFLIGGVFLMTMIITEMITNNAAALLVFPIAIQTARLAGYNSPEALKAIGVTVAIAASCSFATPIGYQTNTIVYGPGGYRFMDYMRVGIPLSLLILLLSTFLIPSIWPLF